MKKIYLDHGATTPVDKKVLKSMLPYFGEKYGNAMSLHSFGKEAYDAIEKARKRTAVFFGASREEIIFTSGATESNNLVIKGILKAYWMKAEHKTKPHIITTAFEHHCVLDACKSAQKENLAEVTFITPRTDGLVNVNDIEKEIKKNTILISVMYVNNEIGTIQPIQQIGKLIKKYNSKILDTRHKILFHTDATQAVNYFDCNVNRLNVDLFSMSAHKIYGPKGIGALYIKRGTLLTRTQDGGDQEFGKRSGTHNVPGIVGLGEAISQIKIEESKIKKLASLRDYLIEKVLKEIPNTKLNGSKIFRSPNNANFTFKNIEGESLILMLDKEGIAASTGSACSTGSLQPSHVLLSIGLKPEEAHGSLRMTLGKYTTKKEITMTVGKLKKIISDLRSISGNILEEYYKAHKN